MRTMSIPSPITKSGLPIQKYLPWVLIPLLGFLWFWFFRTNAWTGGDSEQWEREIFGGMWFRRRQMLSFAGFQLGFQVFHPLFGWTAHRAMNFVSCLAGAITLLLFWRLVYDRRHWKWEFAILATGGFTALFYGHIETYAQPTAAFFLHLLSIKRVCQRRWGLWTVPLTFSIMVWFHLLILFATPALLLFLAREIRLQKSDMATIRKAAIFLLPGALCVYLVGKLSFGYGEFMGSNFVAPPREMLLRPWVTLTHNHVPTKIWFAWFNGGVTALVSLAIIWRLLNRWRVHRFSLYVTAYLACFIGKTLIWHPDMGIDDWDLFTWPWMLTSLLVSLHIMTMPGRVVLMGLVLGVQVALLIARPIQWAEINRREVATISIDIDVEDISRYRILLNDRLMLQRPLRTIPRGGHHVRIISPDFTPSFRAFYVEGGEHFVVEVRGDSVSITQIE
ncbi:MAG: hypothetical protein JJU11_03080 [Candidatus Sumerlaeia bacterium]|nr:hypothetical protein [Candidatus Sumerlaeia bacterium]